MQITLVGTMICTGSFEMSHSVFNVWGDFQPQIPPDSHSLSYWKRGQLLIQADSWIVDKIESAASKKTQGANRGGGQNTDCSRAAFHKIWSPPQPYDTSLFHACLIESNLILHFRTCVHLCHSCSEKILKIITLEPFADFLAQECGMNWKFNVAPPMHS